MDSSTAQVLDSTPIYNVPPEVLHRILAHLIKPWGSPENLDILRISKYVYNVALPLTVKRFENPLGLEYNDPQSEVEVARYQRRNARFLRYLLIEKPRLAHYAQEISLREVQIERQTARSFGEHSEADLEFYADLLVNKLNMIIPFDSAVEWIDSLGKGCSDAHFTFLVASLPGLCTVAYDPANNDQDADARRARELAESPGAGIVPCFHTALLPLRSIEFSTHGLSSREIWHFRPDRNTSMIQKFERLPPRASSIEKISLSESHVSHRLLQALLNSCRAVEEFTLMSGLRVPGANIAPEVRPRELIQAFLPHADTLEYLCTTFDCHRHLRMDEIVLGKSFFGRQLADMTALTTIVADMESITGVCFRNLSNWARVVQHPNEMLELDEIPSVAECLPASLQYLELRNCTLVVRELMQDFLQQIGPGRQCESLRHLRLILDFYDMGREDHLQLWLDPTTPLILDLEYTPSA
ncbi:unnamed protein product [Clonostachys solani]|uniref:F-box domain-containing protein n=1 Tax=Clonostachys solani TaxID=160281 RepID=A0A9P0E7Z8_9HYPO|nr:unnamed protein product [Clonostachys solani]